MITQQILQKLRFNPEKKFFFFNFTIIDTNPLRFVSNRRLLPHSRLLRLKRLPLLKLPQF